MNNYLGGPYFHEGVPIFPVKLGTPGRHNPEKMGTRVPIIPGIWGPGVPILGRPHFHMTPVQLHGRLGADSWKASGVLDPDMKVHEWP